MPQHRVGFMQLVRRAFRPFRAERPAPPRRPHFGFFMRQEFMQWRIEQADCDRQAFHDREQIDEIFFLHRLQFCQRGAAAFFIFGDNHFAHRGDARRRQKTYVRCGTIRSPPRRISAPCAHPSGVSALARTFIRRMLSAQPISFSKSPDNSGCTVAISPSMISPVEPSIVTIVARFDGHALHASFAAWRNRYANRPRPPRKNGPCRAQRPPRGWSCRRGW